MVTVDVPLTFRQSWSFVQDSDVVGFPHLQPLLGLLWKPINVVTKVLGLDAVLDPFPPIYSDNTNSVTP